jgi:hypothetical protein
MGRRKEFKSEKGIAIEKLNYVMLEMIYSQ